MSSRQRLVHAVTTQLSAVFPGVRVTQSRGLGVLVVGLL